MMTKKRIKEICIIMGVIISICLALTLILHMSGLTVQGAMETAQAGTEIEHTGEEVDNYDLVVLEEEEIPGAAVAPEESRATMALWVMAAAFIIVLLIGYELWYESLQSRIEALSVGDKAEEGILKGVNRLHPFKTINAKREMENKAAQDYFK